MPSSAQQDVAQLFAHAQRLLEALGYKTGNFVVAILPDPPAPGGERPAQLWLRNRETILPPSGELPDAQGISVPTPAPPNCRRLTELESEILDYLRQTGAWRTTAEMAAKLGREPTSDFRCVLRGLAEVDLVITCQRRGVRLAAVGE